MTSSGAAAAAAADEKHKQLQQRKAGEEAVQTTVTASPKRKLQFTIFRRVKRRRAMEGMTAVKRFLHISIAKSFRGANITKCTYLGACLQEMNLTIDDLFIEHLVTVLPAAFFDYDVNDIFPLLDGLGGFNFVIGDNVPDTTDRLFFGQSIQLHPMLLYISFVATREPSQTQDSKVMTMLQTVGMAVQTIDRAPIRINSLLLDHVFGRRADVFSPIGSHYAMQFTKEAFKVLGAVEFILNPVGLLSNVADGVFDLFYEPAVGLVQSPGAFARGLGRGVKSLGTKLVFGVAGFMKAATGSVAGVASKVTFDEEYQRERSKRMRVRPKHVGDGMSMAAGHFGRGLYDGITGVFTKPYEGAKKDGLLGGIKGIGKGLVGLITKPIIGTFDMLTTGADALRGGLTDDNLRQRHRPPRPLSAGALRPYSWDEAKMYENLISTNNAAYAEDNYLFHMHVPADDKTYIISNTTIVCTFHKQETMRWGAPYTKIVTLREDAETQPVPADPSVNNNTGNAVAKEMMQRPPGGVDLVLSLDVNVVVSKLTRAGSDKELRIWCPSTDEANKFVHFVHLAAPQLAMQLKKASLSEAAALAAATETAKQAGSGNDPDLAAARFRELQQRAQASEAESLKRTKEMDDKSKCCGGACCGDGCCSCCEEGS